MHRRRWRVGRMEPMGTLTAPSAVGGINWPGGAVDPVEDVLYVASENTLYRAQVTPGTPGEGRFVSRYSRSSQ